MGATTVILVLLNLAMVASSRLRCALTSSGGVRASHWQGSQILIKGDADGNNGNITCCRLMSWKRSAFGSIKIILIKEN